MPTTTPNQGPATTTFVPPSSCLGRTTFTEFLDDGTRSFIGDFTLGTDEDCYPPATAAVSPTTNFVKLYSPGICPQKYHYATAYTHSISGQNYGDGVTRYVCCPESYTATIDDWSSSMTVSCLIYTGFVPFATGRVMPVSRTALSYGYAFNTASTFTEITSTSLTFDPDQAITASPIIVAWQKKDHEVLSALRDQGLSLEWPPATQKRNKILMGTFIPIGVILIITAWLFLRYRRGKWPNRRRQQVDSDNKEGETTAEPESKGDVEPVVTELQGDDRNPNVEIDGQQRDMPTTAEADSRALGSHRRVVAELPTEYRSRPAVEADSTACN